MEHSRRGRIAYVNGIIVLINVLYFLYLEMNGNTSNAGFMLEHGAMYAPYVVEQKEYYRLLTAVFMHFGFSHLMNNMVILFVLGDNMERALGKFWYLMFYLTCGVGANVVSMVFGDNDYYQSVSAGASGAIFGVIGGLCYIVAINHGRLEDLSSSQMGLLAITSLYFGFTSTGVDNWAHVGGLVLGVILAVILYRKPDRNTGRE
ncbi:MAG: rhomboid family intramembrane serine protease [Lachnospiraceae bacterium]